MNNTPFVSTTAALFDAFVSVYMEEEPEWLGAVYMNKSKAYSVGTLHLLSWFMGVSRLLLLQAQVWISNIYNVVIG